MGSHHHRRSRLAQVAASLLVAAAGCSSTDDPPTLPTTAPEAPEAPISPQAASTPCKVADDCASGVCIKGKCAPASCVDGVKNEGESGVDCGGRSRCPPCADGKTCTVNGDCANGFCVLGVCASTRCNDGKQNGKETDVDCGGGACPSCDTGQRCNRPTDCASNICTSGLCAPAPCATGLARCNGVCVDLQNDSTNCGLCSVSCPAGDLCYAAQCMVCKPFDTRPCYSGLPGTEGVGACKAGTEVCDALGTSFGACTGQVLPTAEDCATAADEDCDGLTPPCTVVWSKRFGDASPQYSFAVANDGAGDVFLAGSFTNAIDLGGGSFTATGTGAFLTRLDAAGNHVWSKGIGATGVAGSYAVGRGVAADDAGGKVVFVGEVSGSADFGGGALASTGAQDAFVAAYDGAGTHLWSKVMGDASAQYARAVALDPAGNVVIAGYFSGAMDLGGGVTLSSAGGEDAFVAKLDASGNALWARRAGDGVNQRALAVAVDPGGAVYVTGRFYGGLDFGGGTLTSAGSASDIFIAKLEPDGGHAWSKRFGATSADEGHAVAARASGAVLVGSSQGSIDFGNGPLVNTASGGFVVRFDPTGAAMWSKVFANGGAWGVALDRADDVVVIGDFSLTSDFGGGSVTSAGGADLYVVKLAPEGTYLWSHQWGDPTLQYGNGVATDATLNVTVSGYFNGTMALGNPPLTSAGGSDVFLARLIP